MHKKQTWFDKLSIHYKALTITGIALIGGVLFSTTMYLLAEAAKYIIVLTK